MLPVDYGVLCWIFVLWPLATWFAVVYACLLVVNIATLVYFTLKWYRELVVLDSRKA